MMAGVGGAVGNTVGVAVNSALSGINATTPTHQASFCDNCGAQLVSGASFCDECGNPVDTNKCCAQCGYTFERPGKFCPKCGNKRGV